MYIRSKVQGFVKIVLYALSGGKNEIFQTH